MDIIKSEPASKRVLVVDDQEDIRFLLESILLDKGFQVDMARDGGEAWSLLNRPSSRYDLIITDNKMPVLTGIELVRKVREIHYPVRIIALSGNLTPATSGDFQRLNVDRILHKPCPINVILSTVDSVLAQPKI